MKEQLIKLSKQKGFLSEDNLVTVNDDYFYLWMCELQKWLREEHGIDVYCMPVGDDSYKWYNNIESHNPVFTGTYEEALEVGLQEALKTIEI
jgi:hypothetical protein